MKPMQWLAQGGRVTPGSHWWLGGQFAVLTATAAVRVALSATPRDTLKPTSKVKS